MLKQLKSLLKRSQTIVSMHHAISRMAANQTNNLRDIRDTYFGGARRPQKTPYGFTLQGSASMHHRGMQEGTFEQEETTLILGCLNEAKVFVDVGANIGFYSCLGRSIGKRVIAIEPSTRNLDHLYANLLNNGWNDVEVFPVGLSERPGIAKLYGASSTGASLIKNWAGAYEQFYRIISLTTLDTIIGNRFAGEELFIKIDVEGVEYSVLKGAVQTLRRSPRPTWIIEICLSEFYPQGLNPDYAATFELFWQQGYEVRTADQRRNLIQPADVSRWVRAGASDSGVINYLFVPKKEPIR
jgi:FkbM family methyltransferase